MCLTHIINTCPVVTSLIGSKDWPIRVISSLNSCQKRGMCALLLECECWLHRIRYYFCADKLLVNAELLQYDDQWTLCFKMALNIQYSLLTHIMLWGWSKVKPRLLNGIWSDHFWLYQHYEWFTPGLANEQHLFDAEITFQCAFLR